jgi:hypothetical protein
VQGVGRCAISFNNFIPEMWADPILDGLQKKLVFGALFNTDFEGTISTLGDTVNIMAIGDITISDYTKDTSINSPQSLTDAQTKLTITKAKYFNFAIDDVDQMQGNPQAMAKALLWAGYKFADAMDQFYAGYYVDAANNVGSSASPITPSTGTVGTMLYDYLLQINQKLTESLTPLEDRWMVIAPWMTVALKSDIRFTGYGTDASRATIMSGNLDGSAGPSAKAIVGTIDGAIVYQSVNAPHLSGTVGTTGSTDVVYAGHSMAVTKAEGLAKTEAYRPPDRFSDAVKGLTLFGAKTVRPSAVAAGYFTHP